MINCRTTWPPFPVAPGPARGRIVNVDLDRQPPFFSPDPDLLTWYERWLDETADGLDTHGFEISIAGDEATLTVTLRDDPDTLSCPGALR